MKVIVGDCEVFKHYFLFVATDIATGETNIIETRDDLLDFYNKNLDSIWVFYNAEYDRHILKAKLLGTYDTYTVSQEIIYYDKKPFQIFKRKDLEAYPMICYDAKTTPHGLKKLEAFMGEDIRETTVPFDLQRPLTQEEKAEVIFYCKHDVEQTCKVLKHIKPAFTSHLAVCREFNLPLVDNLHKNMPKLAEAVLMGEGRGRAKFNDEFDVKIPSCIQLTTYKFVQKWFENILAKGRDGEEVYDQRLECDIAGVPHVFAWGGVHGALPKYKCTGNIVALDVTSFYPSMIIAFNYYSRNWQSPQQYKDMYDTRVKLKAAKDPRQTPYKLALNSSYGLLKDKLSRSYDPRMANSVCITGQLLLLMLMERIESADCADLIQSNSDGVYYNVHDEDKLRAVYKQWELDTGMKMEEEHYNTIVQKDVNNYILIGDNNVVKTKGILLKKRSPVDNDTPIIQRALQEYFVNGTDPRTTIEACDNLIDFQIIKSRPSSFDYMELNGVQYNLKYYRLFAARGAGYRNAVWSRDGKYAKVSGTPESCAVDNSNIVGVPCPEWLDKEWYILKVVELIHNQDNDFAIGTLLI